MIYPAGLLNFVGRIMLSLKAEGIILEKGNCKISSVFSHCIMQRLSSLVYI